MTDEPVRNEEAETPSPEEEEDHSPEPIETVMWGGQEAYRCGNGCGRSYVGEHGRAHLERIQAGCQSCREARR